MANKLLILGAAMAHKNKSYNLSNAISKGVDKAVNTFGKIITAKQQRLDKIKAGNDLVTGKVNDYLAKLDPENLNLELIPDPIRKSYYGALNGAKSELGKLLIENSGSNAGLYAPGTDGYIEMQDKINTQRKKIDRLYKNATKFQEINANWFNEHGNISNAWKAMNPELYAAMSKILNTENPDYTVELDDAGDWIISTDIDVIDDSNTDPNFARSGRNRSSKNIKVNLDDLDWNQIADPEVIKINDIMQASIEAGQKGATLTGPQINEMISGFDTMIGNNEGALYSLMFDELPIGTMGGKISIFTDEQFAEDYPNFDVDDPSTYPDFQEMKQKTIDRLVGMIKTENETELKKYNTANIDEDFEDFAGNVASFYGGLQGLGDKPSEKDIINYVVNKSPFKGEVNMSSGSTLIPKSSSVSQSTLEAFDIGPEIKQYIDSGYKNADALIAAIIRETRSSREANKVPRYFRQWNAFGTEKKNEYHADGI